MPTLEFDYYARHCTGGGKEANQMFHQVCAGCPVLTIPFWCGYSLYWNVPLSLRLQKGKRKPKACVCTEQ